MENSQLSALAPTFVPISSRADFGANGQHPQGHNYTGARQQQRREGTGVDQQEQQHSAGSDRAERRTRERRRTPADSAACEATSADAGPNAGTVGVGTYPVSQEGPRPGRGRGRAGLRAPYVDYSHGRGHSTSRRQRDLDPGALAAEPGSGSYTGLVDGVSQHAPESQPPPPPPSRQLMQYAQRHARYQGHDAAGPQDLTPPQLRGAEQQAPGAAPSESTDHWRARGGVGEAGPSGRGSRGGPGFGASNRGGRARAMGRGRRGQQPSGAGAGAGDVSGAGNGDGFLGNSAAAVPPSDRDEAGYGARQGADLHPSSAMLIRGRGRRGGRRGGFSAGRGADGLEASSGTGEGDCRPPRQPVEAGDWPPSRQRQRRQSRDAGPGGVAAPTVESSEAAGERAPDAGARSSSDSDSEGGHLTCVICCEEVTAVAVGACGHSHTCARCCLRLRLCYRDLRCPLCKAVNDEVVVARPPLPPGATFESMAGTPQLREALWQQPKWARGVLVCENPLRGSLMAMTSPSCRICDKHGRRPFGTMGLLLSHLRGAHDRTLCDVCLGAGLKFPMEYPAFDAAGLAAHMEAEHPRCEYCDLPFYGWDELYSHMTQRHYTCHVCSRLGRHHLYFQDADVLQVHLREAHHACDHPDCVGCMIAFATRDELNTHVRDHHSSYMPRWDQSRARPLLLDFITPRGPGAAAALAGPPARAGDRGDAAAGSDRQRGGRRGGARGAADASAAATSESQPTPPRAGRGPLGSLADPEAFPSLGGGPGPGSGPGPASAPPPPAGLGDMVETEGGLAVIDDDLGLGAEGGIGVGLGPAAGRRGPGAAGGAAGAPGPGTGPGARLAGAWAGRTPGSGTFGEDFPQLSSAAAGSMGPTGGATAGRSAWGWGAAAPAAAAVSSSSPPAGSGGPVGLRKVTVRCPCGRRVDHLALRPDEKAPPLRCDRECVAAQRRSQLAEAFGVASAETHVPYFDRHRTPNYSAELIQAAQALGVEWVASVERYLARFLADPSLRRTSLPAGMSQVQRRLVHQLAEHYGLTSHSLGQGAARAVQVLRGASSGVPTRLLSAVAAAVGPEELARMAAGGGAGAGGLAGGGAGGSWALRLVDVAPGTDVQHYLRAWEGDYTLTPAQPSSGNAAWGAPISVLVAFSREASFRDCCARLGGGVRGVFRTVVERDRVASAAAAATAGAATASTGTAAAKPPPTAAAEPPPGWQVLRSKTGPVSASVQRKLAAPGGAAVPAAASGPLTVTVAAAGDRVGPAGAGAGSSRAAREGDRAAAVRAALAADAWDSGDDSGAVAAAVKARQLQNGGAGAAGGSVAPTVAAAGSVAAEPRLPGRGPPLDLARETLWSALRSQNDQDWADEGGDEDGGEEAGRAAWAEGNDGKRGSNAGASSADANYSAEATSGTGRQREDRSGGASRPVAWDDIDGDSEW